MQLADFSNQSFYDPNYNITKGQKHKLTMCADTISQTKAMSILGRYPPVQLIQTYFECRPLLQTAVVTSVGNAVGAANLAISVGTIVVGFLLVFGTNVWLTAKQRSDKLMAKAEKAEVAKVCVCVF